MRKVCMESWLTDNEVTVSNFVAMSNHVKTERGSYFAKLRKNTVDDSGFLRQFIYNVNSIHQLLPSDPN